MNKSGKFQQIDPRNFRGFGTAASDANLTQPHKSRLPLKIFWISALFGIFVGLILSAIQINYSITTEREKLNTMVHRLMNSLSASAADAAYQLDEQQADLVLLGFFVIPGVHQVMIEGDIDGILAERTSGVPLEEPGLVARILFGNDLNFETVLAVPNRTASVGKLSVTLDLNELAKEFTAKLWFDSLMVFSAVLALSAWVGILFYLIMARPLVHVSDQLRRKLEYGDQDHLVNIPSFRINDELRVLLENFNSLAKSKEAADQELNFQKLALDEHAIVTITNARGNITYANQKFSEISGYSIGQLIGNNHRIFKSGEHSPEFYKDLWRTISKGKIWTGDIRNLKKNGGSYWSKATIIPDIDDDGKPYRYIAIRTDISNTVMQKSQIRRLKSTLDLTHDEVYMFDPDNLKFFYVNQSAIKKLGYSEYEFINMGPLDIKPEFNEESFREILKSLDDGLSKKVVFQTKHLTKNGRRIPVEVDLQLINPAEGTAHYVAVVQDISEKKSADTQIRQFKSILDKIDDPVYMFWPDSLEFFYVNQAAIDFTGKSAKELYTMAPIDLNPNFDLQTFRTRCRPLVFGTTKSITYETEHLDRNGNLVSFESLLQIIEPKGDEPRFVAIARDIRKRGEVERAKSEFMSMVSHELRTPLTSIKGALGLVLGGVAGNFSDEAAKILHIAQNNSARLEALINDIFDTVNAETGSLELQIEPINLTDLVRDAVKTAKFLEEEFRVGFTICGLKEELWVAGDKNRLMQVMRNLLVNAAKFSEAGSEVSVSLWLLGNTAQISVQDSGPGIPNDALAKVFEKFTQQDSSDQRRTGGTGLGLSLTKAIVEAHGGSVRVSSEIGQGSTFFVELKILDPESDIEI